MKARVRKRIAMCLAFSLILSLCLQGEAGAKSKKAGLKISTAKVTLQAGQKKTVTFSGKNKSKISKISIQKKYNKKVAKVSVKKKKIYVTGKKKGQTKIRVLVKFKKHSKLKAKKFVIKVNVQKKKQKSAAKTNVKTQTVNKKPVVTQKPATSGTGSTVNSGSSVDKKITRSEWVSILCKKLDIDTSGINLASTDLDYADISDDKNAVQIEAAHKYGLLPEEGDSQDVPCFNPQETVTREYMAYTLSKALGFEYSGEPDDCEDLDESVYQDEVANIIKAKVMKLHNDKFNPKQAITKDDVEFAEEKIDEWTASTDLSDAKEYDHSVYQEDVKDYSDCTEYSLEKNNSSDLTLKGSDLKNYDIEEKDIIVLGKNDAHPNGVAVEIVEANEDGSFSCKDPDIEDVYSKIDTLGQGEIDYEDAKAASDDISLKYEVNEDTSVQKKQKTEAKKKVGGSFEPKDVKFIFDMGKGKKITDNLKLQGKVTVSIPEITALLDADVSLRKGVSIDEMTLSMREKVDIAGGLYWTVAETGQSLQNGSHENDFRSIWTKAEGANFEFGRIELGSIPIDVAYGFGINLKLFAEVSMKGEVSITYSMNAMEGIQYKDDTFRILKDYSDTLSLFEVSGSGYVQIGVAADVAWMEIFDIVGVTFQVGPAFNVKVTPHAIATDPLICANASFYLGAKLTLDKETILGELLKDKHNLTIQCELLKDDSKNPLRLNFHMENFKRVQKCTYGAGTIEGAVVDSASREPIKRAMAQIYMKGKDGADLLIRTVYTDADGRYKVDNLADGTYCIVITATNYKQCSFDDVKIVHSTVMTADVAEMVKRDDSTGTLRFKIVSAVTGEELKDWNYNIRSINTVYDMEDISGTSGNGIFEREVACGNYQVTISKKDYITASQVVNVAYKKDNTVVIAVSPCLESVDSSEDIRFVLTWGEEPMDLDSHVFIKNKDQQVVGRVYFDSDEYEDENTSVNLDVDDRDSYGPETITIAKASNDYTYSYYVYDYTNEDCEGVKELSLSSAKVSVYAGEKLLYAFNVPYNRNATAWKVFDYNPSTGQLVIHNQLGDSDCGKEFGKDIQWAE